MAAPRLVIKTGSDLVLSVQYLDETDLPIDLTGYSIDVDFIDPSTDAILANLSIGSGVTIVSLSDGTYTIDAGSTSAWPLGKMPFDIMYTFAGVPRHTETINLDVQRGYTT